MKYKILNTMGLDIEYSVFKRFWLLPFYHEIAAFNTEKEAVEFIEERIRLEKKYS